MFGLRRSYKALPKSQFCIKRRSWSLFGDLLSIWSTTAFWIPEKPLHLRSMLCKLMRYIENCNACSQHWSTKRAQLYIMKMLGCTSPPTNSSKVEWIGLWSFASSTIFHLFFCQLLTTSWSILTTFFQGKCFHNQQEVKNAFKGFACWILKHNLHDTEIYLFIVNKNVLITVIPILINENMFVPSYNDLNFAVWQGVILIFFENESRKCYAIKRWESI